MKKGLSFFFTALLFLSIIWSTSLACRNDESPEQPVDNGQNVNGGQDPVDNGNVQTPVHEFSEIISASDPSVTIETETYTTGSGDKITERQRLVSASKDNTTVRFVFSTGSKPAYTDSQYRAYSGTEIEFIPPQNTTLVRVEFTFAGSDSLKSGPLAPNRGDYDYESFLWTGCATQSSPLSFSPEAVVWITQIKVTYREGLETPSENIPPFEPAAISSFMAGKKGSYTVSYTGEPCTALVDPSAFVTETSDNDELLFGNPTGASKDTSKETNYLLKEEIGNYTVSYNNVTHNPNWVAWHLCKADLGDDSVRRQDDFRANEKLPSGWYKVTSSDYGGSGFDQGHMLNSYDRKSSVEINSSTFYMTNMVPQSATCNRGTWKGLEDFEQKLAEAGKELYIFCGPYGVQGDTQKNGVAKLFVSDFIQSKTDPDVKITVPRYLWKILLVLDEGSGDINRVSSSTTVIAVIMPNSTCVKGTSWSEYVCSVDYIESLTGYDFFASLPDSLEEELEKKVYKAK